MILSRKFISDYVELDEKLSILDIANDMVRVGNEYDYCGKMVNATNLVIGEILECVDHPDSDHLHLCKVNVGNEVLDIVCGAHNARVGIKVIVAMDGAVLPGGTIKKGMIRGQVSNGMLCSIKELGIDNKFLSEEDVNGIAELGSDAFVGGDPLEYLGYDDEIIDFELTSNRGDELSVLGLAYEVGAIYERQVKLPEVEYSEIKEDIIKSFNIEVKTDNCSLFLAKKVRNVVIGESPKFIKSRLMACGIRPINNVVDISNYVMLETGQPLHFYDADRLGKKIVVRMANEGEKLTTLDGVDRCLTLNDIVIADDSNAVGLAGVMGGLTTEVECDTKNIIIEAAIFDAASVRKTSKKILRSEASNRFEKGLDAKRTYLAMERACYLLEKYASGEVLSGMLEYNAVDIKDKVIEITKDNINGVLGTELDNKTIIDVFDRLGFEVEEKSNKLVVTVPTRRIDISIKEDLIEEVGRIYGINNIEGKLPMLGIRRGTYDKTTRLIREKLVDLGLNEVLTQVFIPEGEGHDFTNDDFEVVKLLDPLSMEKNALRYSMIPSLMRVYNYNKSRNLNDITIFEMAKGFYKKGEEYGENYKLCMLLSGEYYLGLGNRKKVDFYIMKGIVEELLHFLGYSGRYTLELGEFPREFHPGQTANINVSGKVVGIMGKLHPNTVTGDVYVVEINLDMLFKNVVGKIKYKEMNKYPTIVKDFAVVLDKSITSSDIMKVIKKAGGKTLTNIEVFDVYEGKNIEEGKRSIAFSLKFEDYSKTLTDEEVSLTFNKVINEVEKKYNAVLRDS